MKLTSCRSTFSGVLGWCFKLALRNHSGAILKRPTLLLTLRQPETTLPTRAPPPAAMANRHLPLTPKMQKKEYMYGQGGQNPSIQIQHFV